MSATKKKGGEPVAVAAVKVKGPAVHTPGPWKVSTFDTRGVYADGGAALVATAHTVSLPEAGQADRMEVTAANARMMAASPDMLKALQCVVAALTQNATFPADIALAVKVAKDAIAKATTSETP